MRGGYGGLMKDGHTFRKYLRMRAVPVLLALFLVFVFTGCTSRSARESYEAACALLEAGNYESAETAFQELADSGSLVSESYRGIGIAELFESDYADAAIAFEKSILYAEDQDNNYRRDVNLYLAYCRQRQGQDDEAMEIYDSLVRENKDAEVLFLRGRMNLVEDNDSAALSDFDQAVALAPSYELYINIYEVYASEDKSGDGSRYLEQALAEAEEDVTDYYDQGLVEYYLENYEDARDRLVKALEVDPDNGSAVFLLGKIYLATNDVADARAVYRDYTDNSNTAAGAYNGLALCDLTEGDYQSALENVELGLAEEQNESARQGLLYNEIIVYEKLHEWEKARTLAAQYVTSYPSDEAGLREYEFLSTR